MAIIESLIISSCIGFTGDMQTACQKALEAASKEPVITSPSGCVAFTKEDKEFCKKMDAIAPKESQSLNSLTNNAENKYTKKAEMTTRDLIGNATFDYAGAAVFVARSISSQSVSFGIPTLGICDQAKASVTSSQSTLNFQWNFK